jgi:transcriptional regulator GlxA family with amidase domain
VHRVQDAIVSEPQRDWDMASLAEVGQAAERHLLRLFNEHAGISPLHYLRLIRLERARQSLEYGETVTRAAAVAGFGSDLQLRRAWSRQWGGTPRDAARAAGPEAPAPRGARSRASRPVSLRPRSGEPTLHSELPAADSK